MTTLTLAQTRPRSVDGMGEHEEARVRALAVAEVVAAFLCEAIGELDDA